MWLTVLVLSASFVGLLYLYFTRNYGSYAARGYAEMKATFPLGSAPTWDLCLGRRSFIDFVDDVYWQYHKEKGTRNISKNWFNLS